MTKIEQDMFEVICETDYSVVAAEVAKKWLDKLVNDFEDVDIEDSHLRPFYERWLKENGIIE